MTDLAALPASEPVHPELGQKLHDALHPVVEIEASFQAQHRLPVHATSRLRRDEAIGNAASGFNTASLSIAGALDHARTWYQVVASMGTHPLPVFSHYTLARAAYEPALLSLWLLEAGIDSRQRVGRGYAAQLRSLVDMRKFQTAAGISGDAANAQLLHNRLFDAARAAGYVIQDGNGKESLIESVPTMVGLFNLYDPLPQGGMPEWLYRFLSGYTHGREWTLIRGAVESELDGFDTDMNTIRPDLEVLCFLAHRTISVVSRSVAAHVRHRTEPQT